MTLPALRDEIWNNYPVFHSKDKNATLTKIRNIVVLKDDFIFHKTKTREASLATDFDPTMINQKDEILEDYEKENGIVYILKTNTFTKNNEEIIKIGFTTQSVEKRINQLYTTGSPYKFTVHKTYETKNYIELEKALHKLLKPFQLNPEREFFTKNVLDYIDDIVKLHEKILNDN